MQRRMLAALFVACAACGIALSYGHVTERTRLLKDLQSAGIAPNDSGSLEALRLQWFLAVNRIDPIFAIDGTDPAKLRQSLSVLYQKESAFTPYYTKDEQAALAHLYPHAFLDALPDLQARRDDFFANPSTERAAAYQRQLRTTAAAYIADADALRETIRTSTSSKAAFVFLGHTSNIAAFTSALDSLVQSARENYAKASLRYACLSYYSPRCESLHALLTERAASIFVPQKSAAPDAQALATDALLAQINAAMWPPYSSRALPPLIAEQSACYPYSTSYIRVWWESLPEGGVARKSSVANDIYMDTIIPQINPLYAAAYAQGARYKYQISGHYYLCVDAGLDVAREGADVAVYSMLKARGIFTTSTSTSTSDLAAQERAITGASYIDPHDIAQYVSSAAAFVAAHGYTATAQEIGAENLERLENVMAQYREGSGDFDEVVREVAFESEFMSLFQKQKTIPLFSLLFLRSDPSILFLAGNASVAPKPISFASGTDNHPLSFSSMTSYNALLEAGSTSAQVIGEILKTARIERALLQ